MKQGHDMSKKTIRPPTISEIRLKAIKELRKKISKQDATIKELVDALEEAETHYWTATGKGLVCIKQALARAKEVLG